MKLLAAFPALRIRKGCVLRAYQFRAGSDGNGLVWAMPEGAPFPAPDECPPPEDESQKSPRPPLALDDVMEVIEGDGSPWSYLSASIFAREVEEFGAIWHGCSWSTHMILGSDPWEKPADFAGREPQEGPSGKLAAWTWLEKKPDDWRPSVSTESDLVTVTFYTYSGLVTQGIFRHRDTYTPGTYAGASEDKKIAEGPKGYVI
jgi:hypothetical protein